MLRFLATVVLTLLGNAAGLILASILLDGVSLTTNGFLVSLLFFTIAQIILGPFVLKMAVRYLPMLSGGIALVTVLVVLLLTTFFTDGLQISGLNNWLLAPLIIWLTSVLAGVLLPLVLFKKVLGNVKENNQTPPTMPVV